MKFVFSAARKTCSTGRKACAHAFRFTGFVFFIVMYRWGLDFLLSTEEMIAIGASLRKHPGPCLVFGAGNDSVFWVLVNRDHPTVFLESDAYWIKRIGRKTKFLDIFPVSYTTRLSEIREPELQNCAPPLLELPQTVRERKWATILVDAPQGWGDGPGRLQSIYEASLLVAERGRIFVHDCDRAGEEYLVGRYLGHFRCHKIGSRLWLFEK